MSLVTTILQKERGRQVGMAPFILKRPYTQGEEYQDSEGEDDQTGTLERGPSIPHSEVCGRQQEGG